MENIVQLNIPKIVGVSLYFPSFIVDDVLLATIDLGLLND